MKIKILLWFGLLFSGVGDLAGQSVSGQILDAYFTALTRQHQANAEISQALRHLSPDLEEDYRQLLQLTEQDATLPWAYFRRNLERVGAGAPLLTLCEEGRQLDLMLRRYHNLRLVDPYSQLTVDTSQSMQRLCFFALTEGEKVAEIGFGYGYNLHLLALGYRNLSIYANELDAHRLQRMEETITEEYPASRHQQFHFINGAIASTNLENLDLDLIIMENVFHHLSDQTAFLRSMLKSLGENGEIVIIEEFREADRQGGSCPDLITRKQLLDLLIDSGLELQSEQKLLSQYKTMLRFGKGTGTKLNK
ncbi:class I SAM-dependent methyltransferase [Flavilitoribacter nigricans]|nr:class I SAM-dependent methyltransferase [Flavilitoribacter nigricans]